MDRREKITKIENIIKKQISKLHKLECNLDFCNDSIVIIDYRIIDKGGWNKNNVVCAFNVNYQKPTPSKIKKP